MHFKRVLNSPIGKIIISIMLGLGLATMFRKICKDKNCIQFHGPIIQDFDTKIYKHGDKCYRYKSVSTTCDATKKIVELSPYEDAFWNLYNNRIVYIMDVTKISDLPDNITVEISDKIDSSQYIPMNIHPNPYGMKEDVPMQPPIRSQEIEHQRLPSRDIPKNLDIDEEIKANHIPKPKVKDYIKEYEEDSEERWKKHEGKKHREKMADDLFSRFHTPIVISILFFLFQMPIVTAFLYKYLSSFYVDGIINGYGMIIKSILFGTVFYFTDYYMKIFSEI